MRNGGWMDARNAVVTVSLQCGSQPESPTGGAATLLDDGIGHRCLVVHAERSCSLEKAADVAWAHRKTSYRHPALRLGSGWQHVLPGVVVTRASGQDLDLEAIGQSLGKAPGQCLRSADDLGAVAGHDECQPPAIAWHRTAK